jgi:hypothetical protein
MKDYRANRSTTVLLTTTLDGGERSLRSDRFVPGKNLLPTNRRLGGSQSPCILLWRRENHLSLQGYEARTADSVAICYTG